MKTYSFAESLNMFFNDYLIRQRNVSSNTIRSYKTTFKLYIKYLIDYKNVKIKSLDFNNFTKENILDFLNYVEKDLNNSIQTRNQRLAAIKSFCNYVLMEDYSNISTLQKILSISSKKYDRTTIDYLTKDELTKYLDAIDVTHRKGIRDYTLIMLLYESAAREAEMVNVKVEDLCLDDNPSITLFGKGRKTRTLPITNETKILLEKYINFNSLKKYDYLFSGNRKEKASTKMIVHIVNKYAKISKTNKNIHPHVFRHTRAMHLLEAGVTQEKIRDILGHADISTIEVYAKTSLEAKRKAITGIYKNNMTDKISYNNEDIFKNLFES